jgi:predicted nucleic acid-binding protein
MATIYLLDSGPLGLLAHDRPANRLPMQTWVTQKLTQGDIIYLPEVADYEVRRELTRLVQAQQLPPSRLSRLDQLVHLITYLPVSTVMWQKAADLWAFARLQGVPTAPDAALDADVLLAAQALLVGGTVVTTNPRHLERFVAVQQWPIP